MTFEEWAEQDWQERQSLPQGVPAESPFDFAQRTWAAAVAAERERCAGVCADLARAARIKNAAGRHASTWLSEAEDRIRQG